MELKTEQHSQTTAVRIALLSAMETGNHGRARTLIRELADVDASAANAFRLDVIQAYGIAL